MLVNLLKILNPVRIHLVCSSRAVGSNINGSCNGNGFQRNSVTKEQMLSETLKRSIPGITYISVQDISGGCGAMFEVSIEAKEFIGLSTVKQHRLVNECLKSEIAEMHGIRIHTSPSPDNK